ncbi:ATP-binding response regulator [Limnofasciculus baicalensis]
MGDREKNPVGSVNSVNPNREWGMGFSGERLSGIGSRFSSPFCHSPFQKTHSKKPTPKNPLNSAWALVEEDGRFLGLLNSWQLLKSLAGKFRSNDSPAIAEAQPPPYINLRSLDRGEMGERGEITSSEPLKPLLQLLEQLPLPLSLQTTTGEILGENLAWRELIPTSPDSIGALTATQFENPSPYSKYPTEEVELCYCPSAHSLLLATAVPLLSLSLTPTPIVTQDIPSDISIKNYDRILSFTKIPLSPSLFQEEVKSQNGLRPAALTKVKIQREQETVKSLYPKEWDFKLSSPHSPSSDILPLTSSLCLVLAQDTTEQQEVAKELVAKNADLVHLNRLKDEFLACISHELKTPITAILGLSTLLKDQGLGALNDRQARYARLIYQSGRQLMMVVNDILDLTRIETGQLELTLEPVQIKTVCDRAYNQAQQAHRDKDQKYEAGAPEIPFTLEIESGLEMIIADELRLRQMLVHLLSNALEFTESDGGIGLKVKAFAGWVAFTVWDTGIGIPAEKQHLIFQKFQQLEHPLTRTHQGTGLGLFLTQRLARLHGGDVSFISKSGEGSDFTLLLPPCPPQEETFAGLCHPQVPIRNRLVLIVETVVGYLEDLNAQLERLGYWVVIARSGMEAIEKARRLQPSVIFLNPLLPQLSGWDVLTILKSDIHTSHIPVLVTTTQAEKELALAHNADGFLSLPVQESALLQSLTRLGKHHYKNSTTLTILYLSSGLENTVLHSNQLISQLTDELRIEHSQLQYRILEADDLDQAELLAKVWRPDIVLLDGIGITDPVSYLQAFSLEPSLASLPLVTLDCQITQAANQVSGLSVYPCLAIDDQHKVSALMEVIQVAAGLSCQYSILVMDIGNGKEGEEMSESPLSHPLTVLSPWLQALMQYLHTAGFRSFLSRCWTDVYAQLEEQTVDLLLIRLSNISNPGGLKEELIRLQEFPHLPPILVLDRRLEANKMKESVHNYDNSLVELESQLESVATHIMRGDSHSMSELLEQIHQAFAN